MTYFPLINLLEMLLFLAYFLSAIYLLEVETIRTSYYSACNFSGYLLPICLTFPLQVCSFLGVDELS
jgi:hypothetical protein